MADTYSKYFDIDSEYFPQVDADIIEKNPDLWLKFYPHETFVNLLKTMVSVLEGTLRVSMWVEGSYGTGKSHAVLTLKKLIDASEQDVARYFNEHGEILDNSLQQKLLGVKSHARILTVHRYGSSSIRSDEHLALAMQESIDAALTREGLVNPLKSYRERILAWLNEPAKKVMVNSLIQDKYRDEFNGENVDDVIAHLQQYDERNAEILIHKLMTLGDKEGFRIFTLSVESLIAWIRDVIQCNQLRNILFIWDEFTEYFLNNRQAITGFQRIADFSGNDAFKLLVVTHKANELFSEKDMGARKVLDRFARVSIELPEHMAFKLLGAAMKKTSNPADLQDWRGIVEDLYGQTEKGRDLIKTKAKVDDQDLKDILPMHPYTAIVLKFISSTYVSNQRSMFDFIKNDANREFNGFKWFIDTNGPATSDPLFTVDMLWNFFYEKGKQNLSNDVRSILDYYELRKPEDEQEQRVLKTVLMLQGIDKTVPSDLFKPTLVNLTSALEGCARFRNGNAERILNNLCSAQVLYKNKIGRAEVYNAMVSNIDPGKTWDAKIRILNAKTESYLESQSIAKSVKLMQPGLANRFGVMPELVTVDTFKTRIAHLNAEKGVFSNHIDWAMTFAKNDEESTLLRLMLQDLFEKQPDGEVVVIETCGSAFGADALDQYADAKARALLFKGKDKGQATLFENEANSILAQWYERIEKGAYTVYSKEHPAGERIQTRDQMHTSLAKIVRNRYPHALELNFQATDTLWNGTPSIKVGAKCGLVRKLGGCYTTSKKDSPLNLEKQLRDIWNVSEYWTVPQTSSIAVSICEMKRQLNEMVDKQFEMNGRVSIREIVEFLRQAPFGLTVCNLSAFVIGFLLKEYADAAYTWSDNATSDRMTEDKLAQMIDGAFKNVDNPSPKYRNEYLVRDKEEIRQFSDAMTMVFGIDRSACGNLDSARGALRDKMKKIMFPIWCLKANLGQEKIDAPMAEVSELIDRYVEFASNTGRFGTDDDIASAIGRQYMESKTAFFDLSKLLKPGKIRAGMVAYVANYKNGEFIELAKRVGDENEDYITCLKAKFDASDANWVWREETVIQKIDELAVEYSIVEKSSPFVTKTSRYAETMKFWRDKVKELRVPWLAIKNEFDPEMAQFLSILSELPFDDKTQIKLSVEQAIAFEGLLEKVGDQIRTFFMPNTQKDLFQKALNLSSSEYSDEDVEDLFENAGKGVWNIDNVEDWRSKAMAKVLEWRRNSARSRLLMLWSDMTGTDTPLDWSNHYQTPILCMLEHDERDEAERYFKVLNDTSSLVDNDTIDKTRAFLERATFYERLKDEALRDDMFREKILEKYQYVLKDIQRVRGILMNIDRPYDWEGSPKVRSKIKELGDAEYRNAAYADANRVIDSMDAEALKQYLKNLIRDNAEVGIEIIRNR